MTVSASSSTATPISGEAVLTVRGLGKSFGGRTLFAAVDLDVCAGEALCLMGPSGTGKTTFLRCLVGFERADAGEVASLGSVLHASATPMRFRGEARRLRQRVGMVFQGCHLFAHRTVLANVMEGPVYVQGVPAIEAERHARRLLEQMDVAHRAAAFPHELSGGEQQRVALARALAVGPAVLLLDEPTSALDDERVGKLSELLASFVHEGLAIVAVTHDAAFANALGARVARLGSHGLDEGKYEGKHEGRRG